MIISFEQLTSLNFSAEDADQTSWAESPAILQFLRNHENHEYVTDNGVKKQLFQAYDAHSADSLFTTAGAAAFARALFGAFTVHGESDAADDIAPEYNADSPVVAIANIDSVVASSASDSTQEGGTHWVAVVILPAHYNPPQGEPLENERPVLWVVDSLHMVSEATHGSELKKALCKKASIRPAVDITHIVFGSLTSEDIHFYQTGQQKGGCDCGYWAIYNALMLVYTGSLDHVSDHPKPVSALPLRQLFEELTEERRMASPKNSSPAGEQAEKHIPAAVPRSKITPKGGGHDPEASLPIATSPVSTDSRVKDAVTHKAFERLKKSGLAHSLHGVQFQAALLTLVGSRAHRQGHSFHLVTEADSFDVFDDVVVDLGKAGILLLQAKHAADPKKTYNKSRFLAEPSAKKNDASLPKYFDAWLRLQSSKHITPKPEGTAQYVFFTNRGLHEDMLNYVHPVEKERLPSWLLGYDEEKGLLSGLEGNCYQVKLDGDEDTEFVDALLDKSLVVNKLDWDSRLELELPEDITDRINAMVGKLVKRLRKLDLSGDGEITLTCSKKLRDCDDLSAEEQMLLLSVLDISEESCQKEEGQKEEGQKEKGFRLKVSFYESDGAELNDIGTLFKAAWDKEISEFAHDASAAAIDTLSKRICFKGLPNTDVVGNPSSALEGVVCDDVIVEQPRLESTVSLLLTHKKSIKESKSTSRKGKKSKKRKKDVDKKPSKMPVAKLRACVDPEKKTVTWHPVDEAVRFKLLAILGSGTFKLNQAEGDEDDQSLAKKCPLFFQGKIAKRFDALFTGLVQEQLTALKLVPKEHNEARKAEFRPKAQKFLQQLLIMAGQPDQSALVEVLAQEFRVDTRIAPAELLIKLHYDFISSWLSDRRDCVLSMTDYGHVLAVAKADLERFYFTGGSRIFEESAMRSLKFEAVPIDEKLKTFLSAEGAETSSPAISIVHGDAGIGADIFVYRIIHEMKKPGSLSLNDSEWCFSEVQFAWLAEIGDILQGDQTRIVVIDCREWDISADSAEDGPKSTLLTICNALLQANREARPDQSQVPRKRVRTAVQGNRRLVLLLEGHNSTSLAKQLKEALIAGADKHKRVLKKTDIAFHALGKLDPSHVESLVPEQALSGKVMLAGKSVLLEEALKDKASGLFASMQRLGWLQEVCMASQTNVTVSKDHPALPYGIYIQNKLVREDPYYRLQTVLEKTAAKVIFVEVESDEEPIEEALRRMNEVPAKAGSEETTESDDVADTSADKEDSPVESKHTSRLQISGETVKDNTINFWFFKDIAEKELNIEDLVAQRKKARIVLQVSSAYVIPDTGSAPFLRLKYEQVGTEDRCFVVAKSDAVILPRPLGFRSLPEAKGIEREDILRLNPHEDDAACPTGTIKIIRANAGYGKSSLAIWAVTQFKEEGVAGLNFRVHVNLPDVSFTATENTQNLTQHILTSATDEAWPAWKLAAFSRDMAKGRVLLLLDGLDELKDPRQVSALNTWVQELSQGVHLIIGTRPYAMQKFRMPEGRSLDTCITLEKYNSEQVKDYIKQYFEKAYRDLLAEEKREDELGGDEKHAAFFEQVAERVYAKLPETEEGATSKKDRMGVRSIIGIPLETYLFCEGLANRLFFGPRENAGEWTLEDVDRALGDLHTFTLAELYHSFIESKLRLFLSKHFKIDLSVSINFLPHRLYTLTNAYLDIITLYAFDQMTQTVSDSGAKFSRVQFESQLQQCHYSTETFNELEDTGLVRIRDDLGQLTLDFHHETYKEFCSAVYMLRVLCAGAAHPSHSVVCRAIHIMRYQRSKHVTMAFAAQLSLSGSPMIPGWRKDARHVLRFWQELSAEPRDLLGAASEEVYDACARVLTARQASELRHFFSGVPKDSWLDATLDSLIEDCAEGKLGKVKKKRSPLTSNDTAVEWHEDSLGSSDSAVVKEGHRRALEKAVLTDKSSVEEKVRELLKSGVLAKDVADKMTRDFCLKQGWYWDIDGGFSALALLGDALSEDHAAYMRYRVYRDPHYRVRAAADAICSTLQHLGDKANIKMSSFTLAPVVAAVVESQYQVDDGYLSYYADMLHALCHRFGITEVLDFFADRIVAYLQNIVEDADDPTIESKFLARAKTYEQLPDRVGCLMTAMFAVAKLQRIAVIGAENRDLDGSPIRIFKFYFDDKVWVFPRETESRDNARLTTFMREHAKPFVHEYNQNISGVDVLPGDKYHIPSINCVDEEEKQRDLTALAPSAFAGDFWFKPDLVLAVCEALEHKGKMTDSLRRVIVDQSKSLDDHYNAKDKRQLHKAKKPCGDKPCKTEKWTINKLIKLYGYAGNKFADWMAKHLSMWFDCYRQDQGCYRAAVINMLNRLFKKHKHETPLSALELVVSLQCAASLHNLLIKFKKEESTLEGLQAEANKVLGKIKLEEDPEALLFVCWVLLYEKSCLTEDLISLIHTKFIVPLLTVKRGEGIRSKESRWTIPRQLYLLSFMAERERTRLAIELGAYGLRREKYDYDTEIVACLERRKAIFNGSESIKWADKQIRDFKASRSVSAEAIQTIPEHVEPNELSDADLFAALTVFESQKQRDTASPASTPKSTRSPASTKGAKRPLGPTVGQALASHGLHAKAGAAIGSSGPSPVKKRKPKKEKKEAKRPRSPSP